MNLKPLYAGFKLFLIAIAALFVFVLGVALWVMTGPRSLDHLNGYLESSIVPPESNYELKIEHSLLQWGGASQPFSLHLKNTVLNSQGVRVMSWPELVVTANAWQLLFGEFEVEQLTLANPKLVIVRNKNGEVYVQGESDQHLSLGHLLNEGTQAGGASKFPVNSVNIYGADIEFRDEMMELTLRAQRSSVEWSGDDERQLVVATLPMSMAGKEFSISAQALRDMQTGLMSMKLNLIDVNPNAVCQVIPMCEAWPTVDLALSGDVALRADDGFNLQEVLFALSAKAGTVTFQPHFPEPLELEGIELSGKYTDADKTFLLEALDADFGLMKMKGNASFKKAEEGYYVSLKGEAGNLPVNDVYKYWPQSLAPESREWVTTAVRDGRVTHGTITISMEPDDFKTEFYPDDFLSADIKVEGATIDYIPGYPVAKNANGNVHFTGTTITAETSHADMLTSTVVPMAKFHFSDLNHPNVPMTIDLSVDAPAKDVIAFISPPRFPFLKNNVVDAKNAKGTVSGAIKLAFNAFSGKSDASSKVNWDAVKYDINSEFMNLSNVSYKGMKLNGGRGTFKADNAKLATNFTAQAHGRPVTISVSDTAKGSPSYRIKGTFDKAQLVDFGFPDRKEVQGLIGVDASVSSDKNGQDVVDTKLDMTQSIITIGDLQYGKPSGQPAYLNVSPKKSDSGVRLPGMVLDFSSDKLKFKGTVHTGGESQSLQAAEIDYFRYGRNDVAISYQPYQSGHKIALNGPSVDVAPFQNDDEPVTISFLPAIHLDINVDHLFMSKERELKHVKGHIYCDEKRCESASIAAALPGGGDMSLAIFKESGARKFSMQSNNAGVLLNVLDITDRMRGGGLMIKGEYDDRKRNNPLVGRFTVTDFKLKDAPVLGRILNMSSLTGLVETLSGKGIEFDKFAGDYVFASDVLSVKSGKATSQALGILTEGKIDIHNSTLSLDGSLAPAYVVNSIVGKIPLIGEMLVGGEDEGVFAFSFSVKGNADKPDVSVNPLSVLTPGFMRKFFDIFDSEPKAPKEPSVEGLEPLQELEPSAAPATPKPSGATRRPKPL